MLIDILKFIKNINTRITFEVYPEEMAPHQYRLASTPRNFLNELQHTLDIVKIHYRHNQYAATAHPSVELFLEHFYRHRNENVLRYSSSPENADGFANDLMDTIDDFIKRLRSPKHQLRLRNLRRSESRNQESIQMYVDSLFEHYAKLLVVRIDTYYSSEVTRDISFAQAIEDRDRYLRRVKYKFDDLVGYVWKLEHGERKRFHFHLAFFFNGAKVQNDIPLGMKLGELWKDMDRQPRWYHNCNADRAKYEQWKSYGIGMVHYSDVDKRHHLLHSALNYLHKFDEELLVLMPVRMNSMGKMQLPKLRGTGGRPRLISNPN
ncbi:YagK/YfjJ domain-containing protein [Aeromonas dhakensis]|uniref:YagK/YfjJ domain-containing protein n=1 Tax=Aeromonas dhakensis TaxID=196024 RepID=UPI0038D05E54